MGITLAPGDLWIRDVTVISPEREEPAPNTHVVVRGDRIVWVGAAPRESDRAGITVLEGAGRYLVPGLIDGHVHLGAAVPGMAASDRAEHPELVQAYTNQLPRSYLYFGFTTVVELGITDQAALDRVRSAELGPTVLDCGAALVVANGYPMRAYQVPERFERFPNFLYDARQAESIPPAFEAAAHTPEAAVERVRTGGGRCLKAFYELGPPGAPFPVPTDTMLRQARDAGRRAGLPLLMHANSLAAHRVAAELAPAAVAHGLWFWPGLLEQPGPEGLLPDTLRTQIDAVLDAQRQAGVRYMPTLRVIASLLDLRDTAFLDQPALARVLPAELIAWYRTDAAREVALESNPGGPMHEVLLSASRLGTHSLATASGRGGRILFGSDTPSGSVYTNPPGLNGYLELRAMEAAGLTPRQVLVSATLENARLFDPDALGTVEVGKVADLLLLTADPLASTAAFDAIHTVITRGRAIPRERLAVPDAK